MVRRLVVLCLLLSSAASADDLRPSPKGTSELATPLDAVRRGDEYPGAVYYRSLPASERGTLDRDGQVLLGEQTTAGSYAGYIKAIAIFKQPKKRAWELMAEPSALAHVLPRLKKSLSVARTVNAELTEFGVKVLLSTYTFRVQHWFYPEQSRFEWSLDPSFKNDIKAQDGYWQLFALDDNTTIGEYGTRIDTGLLVPAFLQRLFTRDDIPGAMRAMRNFVDSNGAWHKDG